MKSQVSAKIKTDEEALETLLKELPDNPIYWGNVVRLVAPFIARIAMRRILKRVGRSTSEDNLRLVSKGISEVIARVIEAKVGTGT